MLIQLAEGYLILAVPQTFFNILIIIQDFIISLELNISKR
jgi:hypothetical protein